MDFLLRWLPIGALSALAIAYFWRYSNNRRITSGSQNNTVQSKPSQAETKREEKRSVETTQTQTREPEPEPEASNPAANSSPSFKTELKFLQHFAHGVQGRRDSMEDAHFVIDNFLEDPSKPSALFAIFDGHGGRRAADFAAENFPTYLKSSLDSGIEPQEALRNAFLKTEEVYLEQAIQNQYQDGTTGVVALVIGNLLIVGNVGDSEAVISLGGKAIPLTTIHNPNKNPAEGKRVEEAGGRMYMGRVGHPALNVRLFNIAVSRAIGDILYKIPQYTQNKPSGLTAEPDTTHVNLVPEHQFLILACDGLWDVMSHSEAVDFVADKLRQGASLEDTCLEIIQEAENRESGDNISAGIVSLIH